MRDRPGIGITTIIGLKKPGSPPNEAPGMKRDMPPRGMSPQPKPMAADAAADAAADDDDGDEGGQVNPEWVHYHGSDEACQSCDMFDGQSCSLLKMQVDPGGHCEAFGQKGGGGGGDYDGDEAAGNAGALG